MSRTIMKSIDLKDVRVNPNNPRAELAEPPPDILFRVEGQSLEIVGGRMRADVMADLGRVIPALNVVTKESVLLKRNLSGQWMVATQHDLDDSRQEQPMHLGRAQNTVRALPPIPVPYYRQFDKRKF